MADIATAGKACRNAQNIISLTPEVHIDENTKSEAGEIFNSLGMDMSSAIRLFLNRVIIEKGLPFPMTLNDIIKSDTSDINSNDIKQSEKPKFDASKFLMEYAQKIADKETECEE